MAVLKCSVRRVKRLNEVIVARLSLSLLVASLGVLSCKPRKQSAAKNLDGLDAYLNISMLPLEKQLEVCSQNILIFFVGNGQGLGPIVKPGSGKVFDNAWLKEWQEAEKSKEICYFRKIRHQLGLLHTKLQNPSQHCASNEMRNQLKAAGKRDGKVTLLAFLDGPNPELWNDIKGTVIPDSSLTSYEFGFSSTANGRLPKWRELVRRQWKVSNGKVLETQSDSRFEADVPTDFDTIVNWLRMESPLPGQTSFTQTTYLLKGHGVRASRSRYSGFLSNAPLDDAIKDSFNPAAQSIFMIDPVASETPSFNAKHSYAGLVWSPEAYCSSQCTYLSGSFNSASRDCVNQCTKELKTESMKFTCNVSEPAAIQGSTSDTQGSTSDTQGSTSDTQGSTSDTQGSTSDTQGSTSDTQGSTSDTQGSTSDTQGSSSLTLGGNQWKAETQGQKGQANFFNGNVSVSMFDGHPRAYRFMGAAKTLQSTGRNEASPLRILSGSGARSLLLLDTCSVSVWSDKFSSGIQDRIEMISNHPKQASLESLIVLVNPMPLLIDAIKYNSIDAFQMSLLASTLYSDTSQSRELEATQAGIENALLGWRGRTPPGRDALFSRLYPLKFQCQPGPGNMPLDCRVNEGNYLFFVREQLGLAAKNFRDRLTKTTQRSATINVSPILGSGQYLRNVILVANSSGVFTEKSAIVTDLFAKIEFEKALSLSYTEPRDYKNAWSGQSGFSQSLTFGSFTWDAHSLKVNRKTQERYREFFNKFLQTTADREIAKIDVSAKELVDLALLHLSVSFGVYNNFFTIAESPGLNDPWADLTRKSIDATLNFLRAERVKSEYPNVQKDIDAIENLRESFEKLHSISGIIVRSEAQIGELKNSFKAFAMEHARAFQ